MKLPPAEAYQLWAPDYDRHPNPLLALEQRSVSRWVAQFAGGRVLDAGCGTGRWMEELNLTGAAVTGVDLCDSMLARAVSRAVCTGRCAVADIERLPFAARSFDAVLCSFTLSYTPRLPAAVAELARVAGRVLLTDLHPDAMQRGWKRAFRGEHRNVEVDYCHYTINELDLAASEAGLQLIDRVEACFGEPEREIFERAGKADSYLSTTCCPALLASFWAA